MGTWAFPVLRPENIPQADVLGQIGKVTALRGAMQEQQLRNLQLQQAQYQWEQTQAINQAFSQAYSIDPSTGVPQFDQAKLSSALSQAGHGAAIPGIVQSMTQMQQSVENLQKTKDEVAVQERDALGQLGYAAHQAKDDPNVLLAGLTPLQKLYPQVTPYVQQLQQNPQMAPQLIQWMMNQSPKVQEQMISERKAAAEEWKDAGGVLTNVTTGKTLGGAMIPLPQAIANAAGIPESGEKMMPAEQVRRIKSAVDEGKTFENFSGGLYLVDKNDPSKKVYFGQSTPMTAITTMYGTPAAVPAGTVSTGAGALPGGVAMPPPGAGNLPAIPQAVQSPLLPGPPQQPGTAPGEQIPPVVKQWLDQHGIDIQPRAATPTAQAQPSPGQATATPAQPPAQTAQDAAAAVANIPLKYREQAIKDARDAAGVYQKAVQANANMQTFIGLARQGNIIGYNYSQVEGVLDINTQAGSTRINTKELNAYGNMPLWDKVLGWFGKQTTGASIPPNILDDMAGAHDALARNNYTGYQNALDGINGSVPGAAFKPIPMREGGYVPPPKASPGQTAPAALPPEALSVLQKPENAGKVVTFGNGQQWTWRDGKPVRVK